MDNQQFNPQYMQQGSQPFDAQSGQQQGNQPFDVGYQQNNPQFNQQYNPQQSGQFNQQYNPQQSGQFNQQYNPQQSGQFNQQYNPQQGGQFNQQFNPQPNGYYDPQFATKQGPATAAPRANNNAKSDIDGETGWKISIGIGILNAVLVFLTTSFRTRYLSWWIILILIFGLYAGYTAIRDGIARKKTELLVLGLVGIVINAFASVVYVIRIAEVMF